MKCSVSGACKGIAVNLVISQNGSFKTFLDIVSSSSYLCYISFFPKYFALDGRAVVHVEFSFI